jgi:predicted dehydrogenase
MIFGGVIPEEFLYGLPIEAGANMLTIPFGHAVDALCYVLGSELQGILATLSNNYPEIDLVDSNGKPIEKRKKTAHDFVSITASLINGGGNVAVTYAPGVPRSGHGFYWEIIGSKGTLILEGDTGGHVQMFQPTIKLAVGDGGVKEVEVEKAGDFSFNVGKAWDAWAGIGTENGYSATTWEEALVRHKMIEAIYRSADKGTRENYV